MRNVNDKVKVRFFGLIHEGCITDIGGHGGTFYQVLIDNESKTHVWFSADEVLDA